MGTDFYLACQDCCEFISLHKWGLVKSAANLLLDVFQNHQQHSITTDAEYLLFDLDTPSPKVRIHAGHIFSATETCTVPQHYIQELIPLVDAFAIQHETDTLFLACDIGDLPWELDNPAFATWKELPGPCYHASYLPRNLIEVHGSQTWDQALTRITQQHPWLLHPQLKSDLELIQTAFKNQMGI